MLLSEATVDGKDPEFLHALQITKTRAGMQVGTVGNIYHEITLSWCTFKTQPTANTLKQSYISRLCISSVMLCPPVLVCVTHRRPQPEAVSRRVGV